MNARDAVRRAVRRGVRDRHRPAVPVRRIDALPLSLAYLSIV
jgi:hypothetical protein